MKFTLIRPTIGCRTDGPYVDRARMEPLTMGVLAAMVPPDIDIAFYDDRAEEVPFDEPTDLAVITVQSFTAKRAYEISAEYRTRNVPVLMGGMHATLCPEEVSRHADAVFVGDAEGGFPAAIADFRTGRLKRRYIADPTRGTPQKGVLTRRDIFRGKGYLPISLVQFSRGCPHECTFCATSAFFSKHHRCRDTDDVLREVGTLDRKVVFFVDDNFAADKARVKQLLRGLCGRGIHWVSQVSIDVTQDRELLDLMKRSGCLGFLIGFESIQLENLRAMGKRPNVEGFERYKGQLRLLREYGFQLWAALTLGHDFDTVASIEDTIDFVLSNRFSFAAFNVLVPYPGTPLYRQLDEQKRLLYDGRWWLHPDYRFNYAAFTPKNMTADQLTDMGRKAREAFNTPGSILSRTMAVLTNARSWVGLSVFLRYSLLFRWEVYNKHAMLFGCDRLVRSKKRR